MTLMSKIAGRIRGLVAENYAEAREDVQIVLNNRGDQAVVQGLPELSELVRLGQSYQVQTATVQAALTTEPTTVAGLSITNGELATGKAYLIDSIAMWERVVDTTQQNQTALFAMLNAAGSASPSAGTSIVAGTAVRSLSGRGAYGGRAVLRSGGTVVNDGWFPHGSSGPLAAAVAGGAWKVTDVPLRGLYLVPPGGAFSVQAVKVAATASQCQFVMRWHEAQLVYQT